MHPIAETIQHRTPPAWTPVRTPTLAPQASAPKAAATPLSLPALPSLQVLDVLDIGVLIIDARCRVQHANSAAQAACQGNAALRLLDGQLQMQPSVQARLETAVHGALRGQWSMLALTNADAPFSVAVVPLSGLTADWPTAVALLVGGKGRPSRLALQFFKQNHGLTPAEAAVLDALCDGLKPAQIASAGKVAICTVRSQISAVRNKTGARSVGHLLRMVGGLPPVARHTAQHPA